MKADRTERLGAEIQAIVADMLARGEVKDPRVRDAGLVTITGVRVTGDLREARVAFTVYGADAAALEQVRRGLQSGHGYIQRTVGRQLRTRATPMLRFEVDKGLDNAFRVDALLRSEASAVAANAAAGDAAAPAVEGEGEGDDGERVGDDANRSDD